MNAEQIIKKLQLFAEKYPYPDAYWLLAAMIISLLKIRNLPGYSIDSIRTVHHVSNFMTTRVSKNGGNPEEVFMEMHEWTKLVFFFNELSEKESEQIVAECQKFEPKQENSLKEFLLKELELKTRELLDADNFWDPDHKTAIGFARAFDGLCKEKFVLVTDEQISDKKLIDLIVQHYTDQGYNAKPQRSFGVNARKGDDFLVIGFSNYGQQIIVSVTPA